MRSTLDRAEKFLSLVALLTAMVAAVAIALAARRYVNRQAQASAIWKCLGATRMDKGSNMTDSSVTIIESCCEFYDRITENFYNNFTPDDWSYIVIAYDKDTVIKTAETLHPTAIDVSVVKIGEEFWAVTYHS